MFRATFASKLTDAAARGDLAAVEEMITQNHLSVDDIDDDADQGRTALFFAAENGHTKVVNFLIRNNANPNRTDDTRETPLFLAARKGHVEVVESLISSNAVVDRGDYYNFTPLMEASLGGHAKVLKLLLLNKAELERRAFGHTALKFAVAKGDPEVVDFLLSSGADSTKVKNNEIVKRFYEKSGMIEPKP